MRNAAIAVFFLFVSVPVFADQSSIDPKVTMRFGALRKEQAKDPYKQLFAAQQALKAAQPKAEQLKPKVVCGMMIVPADPTIDPKMRITPPQNPNLEYKIRVVEPPVCFDKSDKK
jgi:hypothetical protein